MQTWNQGAEKLTGFAEHEIVGHDFRLIMSETEIRQQIFKRATENDSSTCEIWTRRRNGTRFWASLGLTAQREPNGQLLGFVLVIHDLTTWKEREQTLQASENRHRRMLEDVDEYAIFMIDPEGRLATWNRGVGRILGYLETEFVGKPSGMLFTQEDRLLGEEQLKRAFCLGQTSDERLHVRKDGRRIWATCLLTAMRDEDGQLLGFSTMVHDNTERRRAQDALINAREDLERRVIERTLELSKTVDLLELQLIEREQLESALLDATENERERFGQDLHDGICQQLTGTAMLARILVTSLTQRDAPEAGQALKIMEFIRGAVDQARDLAKGLHPVSIHSEKGVVEGLRELAERAQARVKCSLESPARIDLPPTVSLHLYRIAQETINNALKHAHADNQCQHAARRSIAGEQ